MAQIQAVPPVVALLLCRLSALGALAFGGLVARRRR